VLGLLGLVTAGWLKNRSGGLAVRVHEARAAALEGGRQVVLNASGYVVARREATVSSKVTGKVIEVLIEEGMRVETGQVLARLDDTNLRASLDLAEAQRESLNRAKEETQALLERASREFDRVSHLESLGVSSAADRDQAQAELKSLQARLARQEADVRTAEREVAIWKQQIDDTIIRAPFSGVAVAKNAQPGEMISPISAGGGFTRTGIGTVVDMQSLEVEVDVNESYLHRVRADQPVDIRLDAYSDWKIPGRVFAIIPTADRQKSTVKVRVQFGQLDPKILPQMSAKVAFHGEPDPAGARPPVVVPRAAIRSNDNRDAVFVVVAGRAERRPVTVVGSQSGEVMISEGVRPGEHVVVDAPRELKPGEAVREVGP
jgi:RND family efflux transporter MFP subunit